MTHDEMKAKAEEQVQVHNPDATNFQATKIYDNILEGTLITVNFDQTSKQNDSNQVLFVKDTVRIFRWQSEVLDTISRTKERNLLFRFIELVGIGGVIAFILVAIFSTLLCVLAITNKDSASIIEVVKVSFTIILGFFFGSQATKVKG